MRVLLIIEGTYPWYRGGVSEWVYQYLSNLADFEFSILQIATDEFHQLDPNNALYPLTENVKEFYRIPPPRITGDWEIACELWLEEQLPVITEASQECEIIHVTNTGFAGWLGGRFVEQRGLPLILTEHAIYWKEVEMGAFALECGYKIPEKANAKDQVTDAFKSFASYTYSKADQVITVSESNIPYQKALGATNITYIPNGIPENWLMGQKERSAQPVIGWVGRCAEMKNPLAFFDLADSFKEMDIQPQFRMLLSDANEKDLEIAVKKRASTQNNVECVWNESAKDYFGDMDLLAITSHNESQPLVMLEALAHQALPTGIQVGDLTEKYGLVFEKGTTWNEMAQQISSLWDKQDQFDHYLTERYEQICRNHTWEGIFEQYAQIMKDEVVQIYE